MLAHDFQDATYVRQSLDYAQFGRVTATLGAGGLADSTGVVTAFAHHGSLLDAATGLQRKGERWYSPDLGRFVSEDPIQDGTNWFMFAGNDPVNYADPSGLSQQGHPLKGGSAKLDNFLRGAVNQALNPARLPSTTFGGFVDANRGQQILGLGPAPKAAAPLPTPVLQFNRSLSQSSNLSTLARTADPLKSAIQQQRAIEEYRTDQTLSDFRRINRAELVEIAQSQAFRNSDTMGLVYRNSRAAGQGIPRSIYNSVGTGIATTVGVRGVSDAFSRHGAVDAHVQSTGERWFDGVTDTVQLVGTAVPIAGVLSGAKPAVVSQTAAIAEFPIGASTPVKINSQRTLECYRRKAVKVLCDGRRFQEGRLQDL